MAIGHIAVRVHSRSKGHSAAAAVAYRTGTVILDQRTGIVHDFSRRTKYGDVMATGMVGDGTFADVSTYAGAIELADTRKNSCILRDIQMALPCELTWTQGGALTAEFAALVADRYHTHCAWGLHRADRRGDRRNGHGHIAVPTRALNAEGTGFGKKLRVLDDRESGPVEIKELRQLWEGTANDHLARAGQDARVDVGRSDDPAPTLGAACTALEREEAAERTGAVARQSAAALVTSGEPVTWRGRALRRHEQRAEREAEKAQRAEERQGRADEHLLDIPCADARVEEGARPSRVDLRGQSRTPHRGGVARPVPFARPERIEPRREAPRRQSVKLAEAYVEPAATPAPIEPPRVGVLTQAAGAREARPVPFARPVRVELQHEAPRRQSVKLAEAHVEPPAAPAPIEPLRMGVRAQAVVVRDVRPAPASGPTPVGARRVAKGPRPVVVGQADPEPVARPAAEPLGQERVRRIRAPAVREVGVEAAAKPSRVRVEVLTALRVARLKRHFVTPGGDNALFTVLDKVAPAWRESGGGADIDTALDLVDQRVVERTARAVAEHEFVVVAEKTFPETPSGEWRQAGGRFPDDPGGTRVVAERLSDRARALAVGTERAEPSPSPDLAERLFEWLRTRIEKLLIRLGVTNLESARRDLQKRESAVCCVPGGKERMRAEDAKILGGSSRKLSLPEREKVVSAVEAWIEPEMRGHVGHVVDDARIDVGFVPPISVWPAVGKALRGAYYADRRPGRLVFALETMPDETGAAPNDEQVLEAALGAQRRAEQEERHENALKRYERDLQTWKQAGGRWSSGYSKPTKPKKAPDPAPPSREEVEEFRRKLISRLAGFVRGWVERTFETGEHIRPKPGEAAPVSPSFGGRESRPRQPADRGDDGPSR